MVECRTPEREVGGSKPTAAVLCPWLRPEMTEKLLTGTLSLNTNKIRATDEVIFVVCKIQVGGVISNHLRL